MTLKFLYITQDPFVNQSEEFVRILAIQVNAGPSSSTGLLKDPSGNIVATFNAFVSQLNTETTAYPYTYSAAYQALNIIIIPPGWSFTTFNHAIAVQGTLEEVLRVH